MKKILFFAIILCFGLFLLAGKEKEKPNRDVILLIDKSLSMQPLFGQVKDYLINDLLSKEIKVGDNLFIIDFYGKTETVYNKKIQSAADIQNVKNIISKLSANGVWTDIGGALDDLKKEIIKRQDLNKDKYVLLLTDGTQEVPQGSKYYSPNNTISHELLKNARTIDKQGWKIQVLSIGSKTTLKKIAQEMGAVYKETSKNPTKKELSEKNEDLFYKVDFSPNEKLGIIFNNRSSLKGKAVSSYNRKIILNVSKVVLDEVELTKKDKNIESIPDQIVLRNKNLSVIFKEGETKNISIPLNFGNTLKPGSYQSKIKLYFNSDIQFSPTIFQVTFYYPNFILRNIFIIIIVIALILALLIFLLIRNGYKITDVINNAFNLKTTLKYEFIDAKHSITKEFVFNKNDKKNLGGGSSIINIPAAGFKDNIAVISYEKKEFHMNILKPEFFATKISNDKFLDKEIEIKSNSKKIYKIKFSKK